MSRSIADVEALLRHTYAEVAERTTIEAATEHGDARVVPITAARPDRRRPTLAVAAALAVVVGGLWLIAGRDSTQPAGLGPLTHAIPTDAVDLFSSAALSTIPATDEPVDPDAGERPADFSPLSTFPLLSIATSGTTDVLTYGVRDIRIEYRVTRGRPDRDLRADETVRNGRSAELAVSESSTSLTWTEGQALTISIAVTGQVKPAVDDLVRLANQVLLVDESTWVAATSHAGFHDRMQPIAELAEGWHLGGSLQEGARLRASLADTSGDTDATIELDFSAFGESCTAYPYWSSWLVIAPAGSSTAEIRRPDGSTDVVALEEVPGSGLPHAWVEPLDTDNRPGVTCS